MRCEYLYTIIIHLFNNIVKTLSLAQGRPTAVSLGHNSKTRTGALAPVLVGSTDDAARERHSDQLFCSFLPAEFEYQRWNESKPCAAAAAALFCRRRRWPRACFDCKEGV